MYTHHFSLSSFFFVDFKFVIVALGAVDVMVTDCGVAPLDRGATAHGTSHCRR
jgi:hypothetical protein